MTNIAASLGPLKGLKTARRHDGMTADRQDGKTAQPGDISASRRQDGMTAGRHDGMTARRQAVSKRGHPDFVKKTWDVRKDTFTAAFRKYQDAGGEHESELVDKLLAEYVGGRR